MAQFFVHHRDWFGLLRAQGHRSSRRRQGPGRHLSDAHQPLFVSRANGASKRPVPARRHVARRPRRGRGVRGHPDQTLFRRFSSASLAFHFAIADRSSSVTSHTPSACRDIAVAHEGAREALRIGAGARHRQDRTGVLEKRRQGGHMHVVGCAPGVLGAARSVGLPLEHELPDRLRCRIGPRAGAWDGERDNSGQRVGQAMQALTADGSDMRLGVPFRTRRERSA